MKTMNTIYTNFAKRNLARLLTIFIILFTLSIVHANATKVTDEVYTFGSSSTPTGWSVGSSNAHASGYLKLSANDYLEMIVEDIFAEGEILSSNTIKVEVSCGTFGTWSSSKSVLCSVELRTSNGEVLTTNNATFSSLNNSESTYRTAIEVNKPNDPAKIAYLRITFSNFNSTSSGTLRVKYVKLNYETSTAVPCTVTLMDDNTNLPQSTAGAAITLPSRDGCEGYAFAGWTKSWIAPQTSWTTTAPTIIPAGSYTPTADESLYPVYTKITEGANEETKTITLSPPTTTSSYIAGTKTDSEGNTWSYYAAINNQSGTFEFGLNSNSNNYNIGSPIFDGKVSSVSFKARNDSPSESRKFLFCSTNTTAQPTTGDLAEVSIPKSQQFTNIYTADLSQSNISQFYIYAPKALGITAISVTYTTLTSGSTTSYISVPNCCTQLAEVTDLEFSSITSNSITVGVPNTYAGKANASGYTFNCYSAFTEDALVATADENGTSHTFTGLTKNTTYYFTAIAKGEGDYCNSIETSSRNSSKTLAQYTITLNPNGGTGDFMGWDEVDGNYTQTIEEGNSVTLPKLDDQIAYTFGGWSDGTTTHAAGTYTPEADVELTAVWTAKPLTNYRTLCTYDIVLKNNYVDDDSKDGLATITSTHTAFSTFTVPNAREGYTIEGYYAESGCTTKVVNSDKTLILNVTNYTDAGGKWIGSDETLYTKWTPNEYTITLDANGGTGNTESINATYNSASLSSITNPTKMGYTFAGWYSGEGGTGILVINTEGLLQANVDGYTGDEGVWTAIENKTLYAQWTPISYTIKWVVNGDTENPYATTNVEGDGALVLPAAPAAPSACSGKVFVGWTEATTVKKNGKDIIWVNTSTIPYDNKTYHAVFADEEELSIAGGDMSTKLPVGWTKQGTEQYTDHGVKFDDVNDYIFSPALGYKDLRLKIRAGYNGSEGSVLTFYAYKEDNSLFVNDEIEITPSTLVPNETYTKQNTIHEIQISANEPVKTVWIKMTSKVSNIGMEYCEVFSTYSDYTTTCEYSPEIHITGDPIQITAAEGVWVQAASALTVTGAFLTSNEHSANVSIRAYTDNTAFQIKTGGATGEGAAKGAADNALSLATNVDTDDWIGAIDVVYKPTQAGITETATLTVEVYRYGGSTVYTTNTYELQGRSLPEQFVIAVTNGSGNWFAVPADMTAPWGLGTHVPYPITVDNTETPTVATNVSPQVIYQAAARTGNVNTNPQTMSYKSVPLASKGNYYLYGSKTSGSEPNTNIQTASFASSEQQKWFLDVVDWNTKQYNMHLHGDLTTNVLAYTTGAKRVGQYSATSGTTEKSIYLLPIGGEIEGDLMDIVDWNTNSITINMNGYTISPSISYAVNGGETNTLVPENQNTRYSFQQVYDRTYDIATPTLTPGEYLQLSVTMGSDYSNQYYQVPYIYSGNHTLPTTLTRYDQVVVRDGCLTVEGAVQVNTIYVYPTAELRIAEGATLTANKIYMRTNAFQSAVLTDNGTINVGQLYYTRIVADKQNSFLMALPFESTIADMRLTTGETKTYNKQWVLYTYDAAQRAETGATGNNWVKQSSITHIQPHTSYELLSGSAYYREYCFPVAYTKTNANVDVSVTAHTGAAAQADPIHGGWNAIASPYTQNIQPQWGAPEEAIKLTRLLDDNKTYYQYVPTIIEPATAFYYQTAQTANLQFTTTTLTLQTPQAVAAKVAQREETDYPTQWINIVLSKQNDCQDQTNIYIHPDKFVTDYETAYDLTKMMGYGNRAQCYTTMPCGKLSFNALPLPVATNGINMGIYAPQTETLTLSITPNNYIQNVEQILLQDHYTNQTTDLLHTSYSFVAQPGEDEERFTIFIKCSATAITTDNAAQHNSQAYAYTQPKKLFLANLPRSGNIVIYDAVGKQIIQQRITQTNMDFVLPTGNYYVKVVNESEVQIIPTIVK